MSRYIDVDDLTGLEECIRCAMCVNSNRTSQGCDGGCRYNELMYTEVIKAVSQHIDACIRDDVESVVHASWEFRLVCSNCGYLAEHSANYCPCCGATMDKEVEE